MNFWQPSAGRRPVALEAGQLFLFKLHASAGGAIVGGGFFAHYSALPVRMTWDTFGIENGPASFEDDVGWTATATRSGVVVANAAVDSIAPISEIEPATFDRVVEVNLLGTFRTIQAALPAVRAERGHILLVNSLGSIVPPPFQAAYAASKAGISAFADSLRLELRGSGTSVGQLYFGAIDTEHFRTGMAHPLMKRANRRIPKSFMKPATAADAAAAIQRAVEQRSRRAVFPRSNAPLLWAPQLMQRMMERQISN